ncbi:hypothetical protein HYS94_00940 [Candidatus Daviesbacteria bacterium]|nr:hypothetical protein [Candidatus Daviesbacteria bacterium]
MEYKVPPKIQYGPVPVIFEDPNKDDQDKKINFLKKIIEIEIGINMVIGAVLVFLVILMIAWKTNLSSRPTDQSSAENFQSQVRVVEPAEATDQRIITAKGIAPIYIHEQIVNIERAFSAPADEIILTVHGPLKKEVLGFLPYWALDKLDDISLKVLSQVSWFGLEVDGEGNIIKSDLNGQTVSHWAYLNDPKFDKFLDKAKRERLKVYVTLKCFNQDNIVKIATSPEARQNFIKQALFLMNSKNFDGINLDFEYIGTPTDNVRNGFSLLVINLNKELKRQHPKAQLTIDTFIDAASNIRIHDVPVLAQNSDALVIMGYDFSTPNSSTAGPVAPMEGGYSIFNFMSSYLEKAPSDKLILAVPYYGYDWPVISASFNAPVSGSRADVRIRPYAEIADATKNTQINWDEASQTPWFSYIDAENGATRVTHFENTRSLGIKYDFINDKNLKGVGIWALGFDGKRNDLAQLLSDKFAK